MNDLTRRAALGAAALALAGSTPATADDKRPEFDEKEERRRMVECGFTEAEADCWIQIHHLGVKLFALPKLHPSDDQELANSMHGLQDRLLIRPAYRKYKELSRAAKK